MGQASRLSIMDDRQDAGPTSNLLLVARNPKEIASPAFQRGRNDTFSSNPFPPCNRMATPAVKGKAAPWILLPEQS